MIIKVKPIHRYEVTVKLGNGGVSLVASDLTHNQAQDIAHAYKSRADAEGIVSEIQEDGGKWADVCHGVGVIEEEDG